MWTTGALLVTLAAADAGAGAPTAAPSSPAPASPILFGPPVGQSRPAEARTYELHPTKDGGFVYDDARFRANVAPDGHVTFKDHHGSAAWSLLPFLPRPFPAGTKTLQSSLADLVRPKRRPTTPAEPPPLEPPPLASGPLTDLDRKRMYPLGMAVMVATFSGTGDITDEYYRLMGEDPYRYEKARFLAATFDKRLEMASRAQVTELRLSLHELPDRLDALWADQSQPPVARRRLICSLWTELRRDERGRNASAVIVTFVKTRLPAGSADAYSPDELAACNRGLTPADSFSPYGSAPALATPPAPAVPMVPASPLIPVNPTLPSGTLRPPLPLAGPPPAE